ncbi:MAG: glycosyltransferase [Rhodospirillales bacterium]|nr:glycosyltransferase [Rhodospirillales bacterium]
MKILFLHRFFPAQYRHVAAALAADPANEVRFVAAEREAEPADPRVRLSLYMRSRAAHPTTHHYLQFAENAVLHGQAAFRQMRALAAEGFRPDVICAHAGFGPGMFAADAFPGVPIIAYAEWFYRARNSDADFLPLGVDGGSAVSDDDACRLRLRNAGILVELAAATRILSPTQFQRDQFPPGIRERIEVLHDGVDTEYFAPGPAGPVPGLAIPREAPLVTYATRGLDPYRGFPEFMRAAAILLRQHPGLQVAVAGEDKVFYGAQAPAGETWRSQMLKELPGLDTGRVHFLGALSLADYRALLRRSTVHVYLTVPFVLSWSLIEAMATGAAIVASDTAPVREAMRDGQEGLLAPFTSPEAIAARIARILSTESLRADLTRAARMAALARYSRKSLLPQHVSVIESTQ